MTEASLQAGAVAKFVKSAREFYGSIAGLLGTADTLMGQHAWVTAAGNKCWEKESTSLEQPQQWMPYEFFRFFKTETQPSVLAAITVLLDTRRHLGEPSIDEPLVAGIWFDFGDAVRDGWEYWYARWPSYVGAKPYQSWKTQAVEDLPAAERERQAYQFKRVRCRSLPLAEIQTAELLNSQLIEPLVRDIREQAATQK